MEDWREQEAAQRLKVIAPLLDDNLDDAAIVVRKKEIMESSGLSYRTIGRYYTAFKEKGYEGLKPSPGTARNTSGLSKVFAGIVIWAILMDLRVRYGLW